MEKIVQFDGDRILTDKGRIFDRLFTKNGWEWVELDLPDFYSPEDEK